MKKLCVVTNDRNDIVESIKKVVTNTDVIVVSGIEELTTGVDLVAFVENIPDVINNSFKDVLNIHPSLLPAFPEKTAIKDAYLEGVKVTGVTVYKVDNNLKKIIAQYPVMIDNYTHYDQLEEEIIKLENKLYPLVIKSILDDKVFDIIDLLYDNNHKCGGCGSCRGCNH